MFNPYYEWLGIPENQLPPNHYSLLGITLFESNPKIISAAADRQMMYVRTFQGGKHSAQSQKILNELSAARVCLLNSASRAAYEAQLKAQMGSVTPKNPVIPQGSTIPQGSVYPQGPAIPQGSTIPQGSVYPQGSVIPQGSAIPQGSVYPQGSTIPQGSAIPQGSVVSPNVPRGTWGGSASSASQPLDIGPKGKKTFKPRKKSSNLFSAIFVGGVFLILILLYLLFAAPDPHSKQEAGSASETPSETASNAQPVPTDSTSAAPSSSGNAEGSEGSEGAGTAGTLEADSSEKTGSVDETSASDESNSEGETVSAQETPTNPESASEPKGKKRIIRKKNRIQNIPASDRHPESAAASNKTQGAIEIKLGEKVQFPPDFPRYILYGCDNGKGGLWDTQECRDKMGMEFPGLIRRVAFSADGKYYAESGKEGVVRIWETEKPAMPTKLTGHSQQVNDIAFSPDGTQILSASLDGFVVVWNVESGEKLYDLSDENHSEIWVAAWSPDGTRIATGYKSGKIVLWDAENQTAVWETNVHRAPVQTLQFSPDGNVLVSASDASDLLVLDAATGETVKREKSPDGKIACVSFDADGSHMAYSGIFPKIYFGETGKNLTSDASTMLTVISNSASTSDVVFLTRNGKYFITGGIDGVIRIFDARNGAPLFIIHKGSRIWSLCAFE